VVNVLSLGSSLIQFDFGLTEFSVADLRQLGGNVKGECTELLNVHALALAELLVKVSNEAAPHDYHLSFGFKGLLEGVGALGGAVVKARVLVTVLENPTCVLLDFKLRLPVNYLLDSE